MIAILGQTEDDILYYISRFTNGETIDELPYGVKVHKGNFGMDEIVIAATGYGNIRSALVTNMLIDEYDPYLVINTGSVISLDKQLHQGDIFIADRYYIDGIRYNPMMNTAYGQIPGMPEFFIFESSINAQAESASFEVGGGAFAERGYLLSGEAVHTDSKTFEEIKDEHYAYVKGMIRAYDTSSGGIALVCYERKRTLLTIRAVSMELDNPEHLLNCKRKALEVTPIIGRVLIKLILNNRSDFNFSEEAKDENKQQ